MEYEVIWTIPIEADNPTSAAIKALQIQRSGDHHKCFTVKDKINRISHGINAGYWETQKDKT